jgi:hypothetical protein
MIRCHKSVGDEIVLLIGVVGCLKGASEHKAYAEDECRRAGATRMVFVLHGYLQIYRRIDVKEQKTKRPFALVASGV